MEVKNGKQQLAENRCHRKRRRRWLLLYTSLALFALCVFFGGLEKLERAVGRYPESPRLEHKLEGWLPGELHKYQQPFGFIGYDSIRFDWHYVRQFFIDKTDLPSSSRHLKLVADRGGGGGGDSKKLTSSIERNGTFLKRETSEIVLTINNGPTGEYFDDRWKLRRAGAEGCGWKTFRKLYNRILGSQTNSIFSRLGSIELGILIPKAGMVLFVSAELDRPPPPPSVGPTGSSESDGPTRFGGSLKVRRGDLWENLFRGSSSASGAPNGTTALDQSKATDASGASQKPTREMVSSEVDPTSGSSPPPEDSLDKISSKVKPAQEETSISIVIPPSNEGHKVIMPSLDSSPDYYSRYPNGVGGGDDGSGVSVPDEDYEDCTDYNNSPDPRATPSNTVKIIFISCYALTFASGTLGNTLTLYAMFRKREKFSVVDIFIANLALSDIMFCFFAVPITPIYLLLHSHWLFGPSLCKLFAFAQCASVYISTFTMINIAYVRYKLIVYPHKPSMTKCTASVLNLTTWLVACIITLPYLWHIGLMPDGCPHHFYCDEEWQDNDRFWFSWWTLAAQLLLPCASTSFFYQSVYRKLRKQRLLRRQQALIQEAELAEQRHQLQLRSGSLVNATSGSIYACRAIHHRHHHRHQHHHPVQIQKKLKFNSGGKWKQRETGDARPATCELVEPSGSNNLTGLFHYSCNRKARYFSASHTDTHQLGLGSEPTDSDNELVVADYRSEVHQPVSEFSDELLGPGEFAGLPTAITGNSNQGIMLMRIRRQSLNHEELLAGQFGHLEESQASQQTGADKFTWPASDIKRSSSGRQESFSEQNELKEITGKAERPSGGSLPTVGVLAESITMPELASAGDSRFEEANLTTEVQQRTIEQGKTIDHLESIDNEKLSSLANRRIRPGDNLAELNLEIRLVRPEATAGSSLINHRSPNSLQQAPSGSAALMPTNSKLLRHLHHPNHPSHPRNPSHLNQANNATSSLGDIFALREQRLREKDRRLSQTNRKLLFMVVLFACSWLPLNIFNLVQEYWDGMVDYAYFKHFFFTAHIIASFSVCYNPLLYAWMSDNYRQELREILPKCIVSRFPNFFHSR